MLHRGRDSSVTFPALLSMGELQEFLSVGSILIMARASSVKLVQCIAGWFPEFGKVFPGYIF